jgi:peptidoglycan/LPS O-acetylase OafA/YrhL
MKYVRGLDTIRAVAIAIVIIQHWGPHKFKYGFLTFFFSNVIPDGRFGVDLFFVLSGYLITKILLTAREQSLENERMKVIKNFYIRRALRIFPIYFLFVFILAYVFNEDYYKNNIWYFLTYTTNLLAFWNGNNFIPHTWSLAVEEQFYIIWPWIIIYSPKKYLFSIILHSIFIGLISTLLFQYFYGQNSTFLLLPCITAFSIGALYAYIGKYPRFYKPVINTIKFSLPVCLILLFVHQLGNHLILIRAVNSVISVALIIYVSKQNYNQVTRRIFNNKLLINIGKISYGIYLYHMYLPVYYYVCIHFLQQKIYVNVPILKILTVPPPVYLIHLTLIALIASLSYKYIEMPFLKLKRYFSYTTDKKLTVNNISLIE